MRLALLAMIPLAVAACDRVTVSNSAGEVGLFVDGQTASADQTGPVALNDFRLSQNDTGTVEFRVGTFDAAPPPNRNEVLGFGEARAPTRLTTPWTDDDDSFVFGLEQPIPVDLTIWVLQGPFSTADFRINDSQVTAEALWEDERTGLVLGDVDVIDARNDPDITNAMLNSVGGNNRDWDAFSDDIGFTQGRINVYWINTVEGSPLVGWSDFGARIVMGFSSTGSLLAHELGHAFSLQHPSDGGIGNLFGTTNAMNASTARNHFTEGQTFRMHFQTSSAVNGELGARAGQPVEPCDPYVVSPACPALERRIWADGSVFPPN